jgi:hypothetical protein
MISREQLDTLHAAAQSPAGHGDHIISPMKAEIAWEEAIAAAWPSVSARLAELEEALDAAARALYLAPSGDDYRVMAISLSARPLSWEMQSRIDTYEKALKAALAKVKDVRRAEGGE